MESIGKWISTIHRYAHMYFAQESEGLGICGGQFMFLKFLYHQDGVSQEYISKQLLIDKGTTARAIQNLEKLGYVIRKKSQTDRRQNVVFLTEKAHGIKAEVMDKFSRWTEILTKDFSQEETEIILQLLHKMAHNAMEHIQQKENCNR
ncbi:MarR family winged helix-turn-helix transcriptional regulator [Melghirimyces algeriensis]|uniref:Transcriptional regulator, MarR family n=1 Tax=Melghirimyces algeriensis TaxID=910412 RepID=A0A521DMQ2_9BACL|nr:MarR family winged helix-turn-helix transcriptional regulator [Melghirimyces algeriensis]SMO72999.1 transcriptional regulator, MarR family [Melghirimyces algeriensis]